MLIRLIAFLHIFILLKYNIFAQFPNLGDLNKVVSKDQMNRIMGHLIQKMSEARKEYDEASFNYAVALSDNAGLYENERRAQKNHTILLETLKGINKEQDTPLEKGSNYNEAGEMLYAGNYFASAENAFKKALAIYEQEGSLKHPVYALVLSNLGLLYHTTGRYELAEKYTQTALDLRKELFTEVNASYAASVNNLAVLYKDMGKFNEAEKLIARAIDLNDKTGGRETTPYALALNNQAMIFYAMGRYNMAEPLLKQSLEIASRSLKEKSVNYVRLMVNLALLYEDMKKYADAENIFLKAVKIKEHHFGTHHPDYAHLLNNLAALYILMKKYDQVEALLKKAAAIYKKQFGEQHPSYAGTISNLGNFYRITDRTTEAEQLLVQAADIRKETVGENHPDYINALESLGLLYWQKGNMSMATVLLKQVLDKNMEFIYQYFPSMSEAEKSKYWEKVRPKFLRFSSFVAASVHTRPELAGDLYNYQLATKALLLNATYKVKQQILQSGDKGLIKEYLDWLDEKESLVRLYALSGEQLSKEQINVDSIERKCNDLEKRLSSRSKIFSEGYSLKSTSYEKLKQSLGVSDAAVEIIQFNKFNKVFTDTVYYAALILSRETAVPRLVLLENGNLLETKFYNIYRNSVKLKLRDTSSYSHFWSSIDREIVSKKNIYVSLDGIYNQINLNTLLSPEGFLVDLKNIRLVTSTRDIPELKTVKAPAGTLAYLIGFPDYGNKGTIAPLPGTKTEIEGIRSILSSNGLQVKTGLARDATEQNIKALKSPRILHIATHGFFLTEKSSLEFNKVFGIESGRARENPMLRAGLLLTDAENAMEGKSEDGILFAFEAMNLLLDNTEIVVMSACETGLGDVMNGEGVYGLQRAFQVAGAKSIIMSLWKANDETTQLLMKSFYRFYMQSKDKQSAFKKAQQELKGTYKDPYYWGTFVMIE